MNAEAKEETEAREEAERYERITRDLTKYIRECISPEKDQAVRLSALVAAMAQEIVDYSHTDGKLVLEDVADLRDKVTPRLDNAVTNFVLERIAKDHKTVAVSSDADDELRTLLHALRRRTRTSGGMPPGLGIALASILRSGRKD